MGEGERLFERLRTPGALQELIRLPENLHLEVKECRSPLSDRLKGYLSQVLSGFANSDGGVLILGMTARRGEEGEPDVIAAPKPFLEFRGVESEILSLVGQAVMPIVEGIEVRSIEVEKAPDYGYVIVLVPASDSGPHRAMLKHGGDREYWARSGDSFYKMEHFQIADMFGRRARPRLTFHTRLVYDENRTREGRYETRWAVVIGLRNDGRGLAHFLMLEVRCPPEALVSDFGVDGNRNYGLRKQPANLPRGHFLFFGDAYQVIHPGRILEVTNTDQFVVPEPSWRAKFPSLTFKYQIAAEGQPLTEGEIVIGPGEFEKALKNPPGAPTGET